MVKFLLTCLLALAFVASPASAAQTRVTCDIPAMSAMAGEALGKQVAASSSKQNSCCGHESMRACLSCCALVCANTMTVPTRYFLAAPLSSHVMVSPSPTPSVTSSEPNRLDPPPKLIV